MSTFDRSIEPVTSLPTPFDPASVTAPPALHRAHEGLAVEPLQPVGVVEGNDGHARDDARLAVVVVHRDIAILPDRHPE
jgi:hypothetical protein